MAATGPGLLGVSVLHAAQLLLQAADALPLLLDQRSQGPQLLHHLLQLPSLLRGRGESLRGYGADPPPQIHQAGARGPETGREWFGHAQHTRAARGEARTPAPERPPPLGAAMLVEAADVEAPGRVEPGAEAGRLSDSTLRRLTFRSRCLLGT